MDLDGISMNFTRWPDWSLTSKSRRELFHENTSKNTREFRVADISSIYLAAFLLLSKCQNPNNSLHFSNGYDQWSGVTGKESG